MFKRISALLIAIVICFSIISPIFVNADEGNVTQKTWTGTTETFEFNTVNNCDYVSVFFVGKKPTTANNGNFYMIIWHNKTLSVASTSGNVTSSETYYYCYTKTIEEVNTYIFDESTTNIDVTAAKSTYAFQTVISDNVSGAYSRNEGDTSIIKKGLEEYYIENIKQSTEEPTEPSEPETPSGESSSATMSPSQIEWEKTNIKGNTYEITYYHPTGFPNYIILNNTIIFFDAKKATIEERYFNADSQTIWGTGDFILFRVGDGVGYPGRNQTDKLKIMQETLYKDDAEWRTGTQTSDRWEYITYHKNAKDIGLLGGYYPINYRYEKHMDLSISGYSDMELAYQYWYLEEYGFFPPLINSDEETETYYMQGKYYAILTQESILDESAGGVGRRGKGFVDTIEKTYMIADTTYTVDDERRGLLYVVISSDDEKGDLIGHGTVAKENLWQWFLGVVGKFGIWSNITDMQRNGYDLTSGYIFYNPDSNLNRYYFATIQDACKFVLYGSAGAVPLYEEIGKTDYGYGYISCEYNNYDLNGFPAKAIPFEQYPMGRQEIILAQHDAEGTGKKFVYIELNYYSLVSVIDSEYNLIINNKYMLPTYYTYTQESDGFINARDKTLYKQDDTYKNTKTTTFALYHGKETANTWDVVYSTYSLFMMKDGQILDTDEHPPVIEVWKDENGNIANKNTATNEVFVNGNTDKYIQNEDKEYENSKGEIWNPDDYSNEILDWQAGLKDYKDHLENFAALIEDFTIFINDSTEQIGEITSLLSAFMLSTPGIFIRIILMSFIALVVGRIAKRK